MSIKDYFTTQLDVDKCASQVVRILRDIPELVAWTGAANIVKSIGFDAIGELSPPFVVVSAINEEDDFKPGSVSTLLPVGVLIGYEVAGTIEDLDDPSIITVIQKIKAKLYGKPYFALKLTGADEVLSIGIAEFGVVDYQSQRLENGSIEAAVLLRVTYRLSLQVTTRDSW